MDHIAVHICYKMLVIILHYFKIISQWEMISNFYGVSYTFFSIFTVQVTDCTFCKIQYIIFYLS